MLLGNLLVAQRATFRPHLSLTLGTSLLALSLFVLTAPFWPLFFGGMVMAAFGQGLVLSTVVMMRVKYLPQEVLGRSSGLLALLSGGAALLSPLLIPVLSNTLGVRRAFCVLGLLSLSALWYLRHAGLAWEAADRTSPTGSSTALPETVAPERT